MTQLAMTAISEQFKPHYAYASDKRYAYGRLLWQYLPDDCRTKVIGNFHGDEGKARKEYVVWARSHPVFPD